MFLILSVDQKFDWKFYVVFLLYVYNVIKSDVIGYIFDYLMFGIDLDLKEGDYYI